LLIEKSRIQDVTTKRKSHVVGKGFLRLSRGSFVSIKAEKVITSSKLSFKNDIFSIIRQREGKTRVIDKKVQNLGNFLRNNNKIWEKFSWIRHYCVTNKTVNKTHRISSEKLNSDYGNLLGRPSFAKSKGNNKILRDCQYRSRLLLRSGDVESNPGPHRYEKNPIKICSFNVRGLKEYSKLKRVLNKCAGILKNNNNTIFNFQETHLEKMDESKIKMMWRGGYISSPGGNKSRGCLTLFDPSWEVLDQKKDPEGRFTLLTVKKSVGCYTLLNLYAPNNHSLAFFEDICDMAMSTRDNFNSELVILGDFNLVLHSSMDSLNRVQTNNENIVSVFIKDSFAAIGLFDAYRKLHKEGGFTWARGRCMSRLDMIHISNNLTSNLSEFKIDWAFDKSDHAMIECTILIKPEITRGPGLPRVDIGIFDRSNNEEEFKVESASNQQNQPNY